MVESWRWQVAIVSAKLMDNVSTPATQGDGDVENRHLSTQITKTTSRGTFEAGF